MSKLGVYSNNKTCGRRGFVFFDANHMKKGKQNLDIVFQGNIVRVETGNVTLPNQQQMQFEVVRHPGGAAVVAVDAKGHVCLLYQYRVAIDRWVWELPAGKIDDAEPPLQTAQRELGEEAGCTAGRWRELGAISSSPGVFDEEVHLYLATGLQLMPAQPEVHEIFEIHWLPFAEALAWARDGKMSDAKSIVALFRAQTVLAEDG